MNHLLFTAFFIAAVNGDLPNLSKDPRLASQQPNHRNPRLITTDSLQVQTKRSPIAFAQPDFNFLQSTVGEQFLQSLQQSDNDVKGNYGAPPPQTIQSNSQQNVYKHQELDEESDEEYDSPENKLGSYGAQDKVQSDYGAPQQSQPIRKDVQNVEFLTGFVPSYGPPTKQQGIPLSSNTHYEQIKEDGSKVYKHVSVHIAPQLEAGANRAPRVIRPLGKSNEKHYNIIFIKAPDSLIHEDTEVHLPQPPQQKTVVYLLAKNQEQQSNIKLATPAPTQVAAPEVYFVKYKDGKNSQYEKSNPTYGPPMQNAYFPLTSPPPTVLTYNPIPSLPNVAYGTPTAASDYNAPVLGPASGYSTPSNSYSTFNNQPTFAPTYAPTYAPTQVFSTFPSLYSTVSPYGTPSTLFQTVPLEEIENPNSLQSQNGNHLNQNQENRQNYNYQHYHQENQVNQQREQEQNQYDQRHQNQLIIANNFQPSRQIFGDSAPKQQYNKPEQPIREYQLIQPPSQKTDYQILQAAAPAHFHISLPNHHFQTVIPEQSGESSTTVTSASGQNDNEEPLPLVFEAARTTSRLNHENHLDSEKLRSNGRRRKVKRGRGRKRVRKVKKSRRNGNKHLRNQNEH